MVGNQPYFVAPIGKSMAGQPTTRHPGYITSQYCLLLVLRASPPCCSLLCPAVVRYRGDLPVANVATTYTFGSPAVFCEGANGASPTPGPCHSCSLPCEHRNTSNSSSATDSLLGKLGLAADAVVNVIMTRDIVPRAFVCDYTLVAGVLKSWLPSFKEHKGLAACKDHKVCADTERVC